ncbi:SIS domain-containing protein [Rothia sp. CCM 9418]|uniref:SIS domain-containing protein n=1 Tax=Rothia sp. CCM 9418 TaxID=3402661 RepID=UPI003AE1CD7A
MTTPGAHMKEELLSQPQTWAQALELDTSALPQDGKKVAAVGCGTSWFMAQSYAALRENEGHGITDAFTATEVPTERDYDEYLIICRSGTTSEIITFMKSVKDKKPITVLVGVADSPVAELADRVVDLGFADEQSVVQTRFATTALMLLRSSIHSRDICQNAIKDCERALSEPLDSELINAEQYSFLGTGWTAPIATEAALKMRESSQKWTESYNSMEYRHGPIAIASEGRITWQFGQAPAGLREQVEATGARFENQDLDPMADLARQHLVALETALANELDPDQPRNLTRSVILN